MNGRAHRLFSLACWSGLAPVATPVVPLIAGAAVAWSFAGGRKLSPDIDQVRARRLRRDEPPTIRHYVARGATKILRRGMGGHRGLTHTIEPVCLLALAIGFTTAQAGVGWIGQALACAWLSHLFADACFGGIPSWIARGRVGFSLGTGGLAESWIVTPLATLATPALIVWRFFPGLS